MTKESIEMREIANGAKKQNKKKDHEPAKLTSMPRAAPLSPCQRHLVIGLEAIEKLTLDFLASFWSARLKVTEKFHARCGRVGSCRGTRLHR